MGRLKSESSFGRESVNIVLDQVKYRANWQRHQDAQRKREEEKIERERGKWPVATGNLMVYVNKGKMNLFRVSICSCLCSNRLA